MCTSNTYQTVCVFFLFSRRSKLRLNVNNIILRYFYIETRRKKLLILKTFAKIVKSFIWARFSAGTNINIKKKKKIKQTPNNIINFQLKMSNNRLFYMLSRPVPSNRTKTEDGRWF